MSLFECAISHLEFELSKPQQGTTLWHLQVDRKFTRCARQDLKVWWLNSDEHLLSDLPCSTNANPFKRSVRMVGRTWSSRTCTKWFTAMCCQISTCPCSNIRVSLLFTDKDEEKKQTQLNVLTLTWVQIRLQCIMPFRFCICDGFKKWGLRLAASLSEPQLRWDMTKGYSQEVKFISLIVRTVPIGNDEGVQPISSEFHWITVALLHCLLQFGSTAPGARCKIRFNKIETAHV